MYAVDCCWVMQLKLVSSPLKYLILLLFIINEYFTKRISFSYRPQVIRRVCELFSLVPSLAVNTEAYEVSVKYAFT